MAQKRKKQVSHTQQNDHHNFQRWLKSVGIVISILAALASIATIIGLINAYNQLSNENSVLKMEKENLKNNIAQIKEDNTDLEDKIESIRNVLANLQKESSTRSEQKPKPLKHVIISGQIYDAKTNAPISGATISLTGANRPEITDSSGNFLLSVSNPSGEVAHLSVTARSYQTYRDTLHIDKLLITKSIPLNPGG